MDVGDFTAEISVIHLHCNVTKQHFPRAKPILTKHLSQQKQPSVIIRAICCDLVWHFHSFSSFNNNQTLKVYYQVVIENTHCPHTSSSPSWFQLLSTPCLSSFSSRGEEVVTRRDSERCWDSSMSFTTSPPSVSVLTCPWWPTGGLSAGDPGILTSHELHCWETRIQVLCQFKSFSDTTQWNWQF